MQMTFRENTNGIEESRIDGIETSCMNNFTFINIRCQQSMLSKKWLGTERTQYSELSVIILGEPPPSDT